MKTILIDAVHTLVLPGRGIFDSMYGMLESYPNRKIILTNADDSQLVSFGLDKLPYEVFTLKHSPNKMDPRYYEAMLAHFGLTAGEVVYVEHDNAAVVSARSVGITTHFYEANKQDLAAMGMFMEENLREEIDRADLVYALINDIVDRTASLNRRHLPDEALSVNYAAVFCQTSEEYSKLIEAMRSLGEIVSDTSTGPLFKFHEALQTTAGPLWLVKVRQVDPTRPQRGDADFTVNDYAGFKHKHAADQDHFRVIDRGNYEMIELRDPEFGVLSYFSSVPLTRDLGLE
jgi:hypothetical protein